MTIREMTDKEMWDFLDREDFIRWDGEYWVKTSKLEKETNSCDCVACQVRRAFKYLKDFRGSEQTVRGVKE